MGDPEPERPRPPRAKPRTTAAGPRQTLDGVTFGDLAKVIKALKADDLPRESREAEASRLRIAESELSHRQKVEWFVLAIGGIVCSLCATALVTGASDDIKKACLATIAALATAGLGFLAGGKAAR